ncbi:hypothetical protein [Eubacterium sp.]
MIIILEGFDTTGKSNLAHYLVHKLKLGYMHNMPCYSTQLQKDFINIIQAVGEGVVIDRFHLSDIVYGKIVCEHIRMNDFEIEQLERLLLNKKVVFIHCTARLKIVRDRYQKENNKYVPRTLIMQCLEEYNRQFDRLRNKGFRVYKLDTSEPIEIQRSYIDKMITSLTRGEI